MSLRAVEAASILAFVQKAAGDGYLDGRVLDYGCGASPYRDLIQAEGYYGYDSPGLPAHVAGGTLNAGDPWWQKWDAILCTQVLEYVPDPGGQLREFRAMLKQGGHLILTYPTNWPEVEPEDLHRFTKAGMERLLGQAGFEILVHERRSELVNRDGTWALGYGVIARA